MIAVLEQENAELRAENARLTARNEELEAEQRRLQLRIDGLLQRLFGRRSERFVNPNQGELFEDIAALSAEAKAEIEARLGGEDPAEETRKRSRHKGRRRLPKNLPREEVHLDLPAAEKICPHGHSWEKFGEDRTEELDIIPAQIFVREFVRPKYHNPACDHPECQGVKMPPLPVRPIEQGRPAPGLLADIAVSKYGDHLPIYRQEQIFARHGVAIPRSTMGGWTTALGRLLLVIYLAMKEGLLKQRYLQADETTIRVQGMKPGKMHTGYLWGYGVPWGEVVYEFALDRSGERPLKFLQGFAGHLLQTDAYAGYNEFVRRQDGRVVRLGCWAHVRRKIYEALGEAPERAQILLAAIQRLYRIEREIHGLDPETRARVRQDQARPILVDLKALLEAYQAEALPESLLGRAIAYALGEWPQLERYVEYGEAEIDNNSIEHTLRPVAVGRKNYLFVGSPQGGEAAAVLYSLITTCKRLGINPWVYLKDVIERVASHPMARIAELTPRGWKEARDRAAGPAATA
ncbi:MAG: IS66 family transposase [Planctomycetes bacterium]|nr:IS66 family transposase [Planctomycetota bacterium]